MRPIKSLNRIIALYSKTQNENTKKAILKTVWENSEYLVKYELSKHNIPHVFSDVYQEYFQILKSHLESFESEKGDFSYWNGFAIKKAVTKVILFNIPHKHYLETIDGKRVLKHEPRNIVNLDENRESFESSEFSQGISHFLNKLIGLKVLSKQEALILFYKFQFGFSGSLISKIFKISHTSVSNIQINAKAKIRKFNSQNPEKIER